MYKGVATGSKHCDKDLCSLCLSTLLVVDRDSNTTVIHKEFLTRDMYLSHGWIEFLFVAPVVDSKLCVFVSIRTILFFVYFPKEHQRDFGFISLGLFEFLVDDVVIRHDFT